MGVLIFSATPSDSFGIWLWLCIFHVSDILWTSFMIVELLYPIILSAIVTTTRSECTPTMSGLIPLSCTLRIFAAVLTALTMSPLVTSVHALLCQTSKIRLSSVPLLFSMWCALRGVVPYQDEKDYLVAIKITR